MITKKCQALRNAKALKCTILADEGIIGIMIFEALKYARNNFLIFIEYKQNLLTAAEKVRFTAHTIQRNKLTL